MSSQSDAAADAFGTEYVRQHQRRFPDWLLMYSRVDRGLLAFYRGFSAEGGILVAAKHSEQLLRLMSDAAQKQWRTPPVLQLPTQPRIIVEKRSGPGTRNATQ
ncbi:hypothetical protein AB0392_39705 [Nonomuraea angiospora]|uniref:hypothetical protein n=1 Tax=Nonomuraea angiospora TaxID=46172 RepID=UPI00344F4278